MYQTTNVSAEAPLTEIEKERAMNIMRINQRMQQLGLKSVAQIVHQSFARKKRHKTRKDHGQLSESTELQVPALLLNMLAIFNDISMYL